MSQQIFDDLVDEFVITKHATQGKWFGLPCIKINGKVFAALWLNGDLLVKLRDDAHTEGLALDGAELFQPLPDRKPMREWVQIPPQFSEQWRDFALAAFDYVHELSSK